MHEIGIDASLLKDVRTGNKTIEGVLGTEQFIKLRKGDTLSIRKEVRENGVIVSSTLSTITVLITQLLYFESFDEMLGLVDYTQIIPSEKSPTDALKTIRQYYTPEDEEKYGVIAITFSLV